MCQSKKEVLHWENGIYNSQIFYRINWIIWEFITINSQFEHFAQTTQRFSDFRFVYDPIRPKVKTRVQLDSQLYRQ